MARVRPLLYLILVTMTCLLLAPIRDANRGPNRIIPYEELPSPELYARCDRLFRKCRAQYPRCEIDRDQCVTWGKP